MNPLIDHLVDAVLTAPLAPADDRLYPPAAFSLWWLVTGLVAIVGGLITAAWALRPTSVMVAQPAAPPVTGLRERYLLRIDELGARFEHHELDSRSLHHELSRTLRSFAADAGAEGAEAMSAGQLDRVGMVPVATAVRRHEEPQFAWVSDADPETALARARVVVAEWSD